MGSLLVLRICEIDEDPHCRMLPTRFLLTSSATATVVSHGWYGCVQVQQEFCFYSSSVLIMYEGDAETAEEANVSVRFVDFAHTFPSGGQRDGNFAKGLSALTSTLSAVACSGQYRGLV